MRTIVLETGIFKYTATLDAGWLFIKGEVYAGTKFCKDGKRSISHVKICDITSIFFEKGSEEDELYGLLIEYKGGLYRIQGAGFPEEILNEIEDFAYSLMGAIQAHVE